MSDPVRRKFYDATGSDVTEAEMDRKAEGLLQQMFQLVVTQKGLIAIQKMDVIKEIENNMSLGMKRLDKNIDVARKSRKEIGNVLRRLRHKSKMNPISVVLKHEIQKHAETNDKAKHEKRGGDKAEKMLKEYGYDFDKETEMKVIIEWVTG